MACGDKRKQSWSPPPHTQAWCCAAVVCRLLCRGKQEVLVAEGADGNTSSLCVLLLLRRRVSASWQTYVMMPFPLRRVVSPPHMWRQMDRHRRSPSSPATDLVFSVCVTCCAPVCGRDLSTPLLFCPVLYFPFALTLVHVPPTPFPTPTQSGHFFAVPHATHHVGSGLHRSAE